jgi:hypothetical protein
MASIEQRVKRLEEEDPEKMRLVWLEPCASNG